MRKVRLGKTGLMVTEVGFGGIPIIPVGFDEAASVVRYCFDRGIRFFDTANAYRDSEKKIGKALEGVRDQVVIATKTAARKADQARTHLQRSLESLRTRTIDLYQMHNVSNDGALAQVLAPGGALEVAEEARAAGQIRSIGVTSHNIEIAIKACRTGRFETLQFPFNFVENDPADKLFKVARELDMGIIAMKPLGGGWLTKARLCLGFLRQYPDVIPIPGMMKKEEVDEVVELYEESFALTPSEWREIEKIRSELGSKFCHRCEYCMPCEQGVKINPAMGFPIFVKRFGRDAALAMTGAAMQTIENCTECGECMAKCPYDLRIPDSLKENLALYREYVQ